MPRRAWAGRDVRYRRTVGHTTADCGDLARLRDAKDLLERDYAKPLNVPVMAREALMSTAHFSRRFREAFGGNR